MAPAIGSDRVTQYAGVEFRQELENYILIRQSMIGRQRPTVNEASEGPMAGTMQWLKASAAADRFNTQKAFTASIK